MVNNEFHLIGIAVSNYVSVGNDKFKVHSFRIEVEKFGAKYGTAFEIEVVVYGTNRAIDTTREILGRQIAVNGYVDTFVTKEENHIFLKLVAQNILVIESKERKRFINPSATIDNLEPIGSVVDDDLPY